MLENGINVLSLCDGMSCGHIALDRCGIKVNKYYAAEIKNIAIKVTKDNYPDTIHIGDVNKIRYENGILYTEKGEFKERFDLVLFGSPCQSFSIAMQNNMRVGLDDKVRSGLFLECYRILKEVNPEWFLVENVASMKNEDKNILSDMLGVKPVRINSSIFAPALRDRLYWTNIMIEGSLQEIEYNLQSVLDRNGGGYTERIKANCLLVSDSRPLSTPCKICHRYFSKKFTTPVFKTKEHYE